MRIGYRGTWLEEQFHGNIVGGQQFFERTVTDPEQPLIVVQSVAEYSRVCNYFTVALPSMCREMIYFKSIGSSVLAISLVLGDKVIMVEFSK